MSCCRNDLLSSNFEGTLLIPKRIQAPHFIYGVSTYKTGINSSGQEHSWVPLTSYKCRLLLSLLPNTSYEAVTASSRWQGTGAGRAFEARAAVIRRLWRS